MTLPELDVAASPASRRIAEPDAEERRLRSVATGVGVGRRLLIRTVTPGGRMNPTVEFLWSRLQGLAASPADWATQMLEGELESDALRRLTDRNLPPETQNRLLVEALHDVRRSELLDERALRLAYESECIADYFAGRIDGWTLIQRGCEMYVEAPEDDPGRVFWIGLADDADEHGGQGVCLQYPFAGNDFDQVLRDTIRNSGRPLPDSGT